MKPNRLLNRSLKFDWMFIALTLALMSVGVALVYSATIAEDASVVELFWFKQIIYFVFGSVFARIYAAYAEVDFFIYKDIAMHEKRKYRYDVSTRGWDRYKKEWKFGADSLR